MSDFYWLLRLCWQYFLHLREEREFGEAELDSYGVFDRFGEGEGLYMKEYDKDGVLYMRELSGDHYVCIRSGALSALDDTREGL